jgi:hypothetical protein
MPWFWTDDLAEILVEHAGSSPEALVEWTQYPTAVAVPDDAEPLDVARALLGVETEAVA